MPKIQKGFTLVELLVTVAIIVIVSSVGFISYANSQVTARDARRKQDLRSIQTALEIYRQKNGRFPCSPAVNSGWQLSSAGGNWIIDGDLRTDTTPIASCDTSKGALDTKYINKTPADPKADNNPITTQGTTGYAYFSYTLSNADPPPGTCPKPQAGNYYILVAGLENSNDPEREGVKLTKACDNSTLISPSNTNAYVVTSQY